MRYLVLFLFVLSAAAQEPMQFAAFMSRQVAAEPPGFSPSNNYPTELVMWLDARLYTTNGGTAFWGDRWTNNLSATNTTAANRPTGSATGCNGVDWALSFDGNDLLKTPTTFTYLTPTAYMLLLKYDYSWTNTPPEQRLKSDSDSSGIVRASATSNSRYTFGVTPSTWWTNTTAQWMVMTVVHQLDNSMTCYTNLNREFNQASGSAPGKNVALGIGARFSDAGFGWPGSIAQFVVLTNALQSGASTTLTNAMLSNVFWWMTNYAQLSPQLTTDWFYAGAGNDDDSYTAGATDTGWNPELNGYGSPITNSVSGTCTNISIKARSLAGATTFKVGLYNSSNALIANGTTASSSSTAAWLPVAVNVSVSSGTYRIIAFAEGGNGSYQYDTDAGNFLVDDPTDYASAPPATLTPTHSDNFVFGVKMGVLH